MIKRNGAAIRTLVIAVAMVALMYFVYLYHDIQSRFRHSEIVSEKFKRDRESLSAQLNEINSEKTIIRERYYKDRQELTVKYSESQQKYKMLLSQHQDLENEFNRLQQKHEKASEDDRQKDINRNQEYMQLKQEKELEIVKLKDQNANSFHENEQMKLELIEIKKQYEQQQLSLNRETRTSEMLRKYLNIAKATHMKNIGAGGVGVGGVGGAGGGVGAGGVGAGGVGAVGAGGVGAGGVGAGGGIGAGGAGAGAVDAGAGAGAGAVGAGANNNMADNNHLNPGLVKLNAFEKRFEQNQLKQPHEEIHLEPQNIIPKEPLGLESDHRFQIPPANQANVDDVHGGGDLGHAKDGDANDLALQKQEIIHRQNEGENGHNQVQPPLNDRLDKKANATGPLHADLNNVAKAGVDNNNNNNNNQQQNVLVPPNNGANAVPAGGAAVLPDSAKNGKQDAQGENRDTQKDINNNAHHAIL